MSKKRKSKVSVWLYVLAAVFIFSAVFVAVRNLPDIDDVLGDDTTVTDDQGNVVPDPDNPGTSTGNGRIENLKIYPAYFSAGTRNYGYYGFSITDLNPNTTYSLYLSFLKEDGLKVNIIDSNGLYYFSEVNNVGYGEFNDDTSRYGVGALKLRSDAEGVLSLFCMYNSESDVPDSDHEVIAVDCFKLYTVALYTTEDDPSEPPAGMGKVTITSINTLYSYTLPDNSGTSGSSSNSGSSGGSSSGGSDSGSDPVYVLDGKYRFNDGLVASESVKAYFDETDSGGVESLKLDETFDRAYYCYSGFDECDGSCESRLNGMTITIDDGDIDVFYGVSKPEQTYDSSWNDLSYQCLVFDEEEVSEGFYRFLMENAIKIS